MRSYRLLAIGLVLLVALSIIIYTAPSFATEDNTQTDRRPRIVRFEADIVNVTDKGIEVVSNLYNGTIFGKGRWVYISEDMGRLAWKDAKNLIEIGDANILVAVVERGDRKIPVLLGVKQEGLMLLREGFVRRSIVDHVKARGYISLTGTVVKTGENYLVLNVRGKNILFKIAENRTWTVAGDGEATWSRLKEEFSRGDQVQVYFHVVMKFNKLFTEFTGIRAIAGGYGTFIDLTDGVTITT